MRHLTQLHDLGRAVSTPKHCNVWRKSLAHLFLPLPAQLSCASPASLVGVIMAEQTGADPQHLFFAEKSSSAMPCPTLPTPPSAGFALDWSKVEKYAADTLAAHLGR